jgi:hypothetical protein
MTVIGRTGELAGQLGIEFAEDLDQLRADAGRLIAVYGAAAFRSLCLRPETNPSSATPPATPACGASTCQRTFRS